MATDNAMQTQTRFEAVFDGYRAVLQMDVLDDDLSCPRVLLFRGDDRVGHACYMPNEGEIYCHRGEWPAAAAIEQLAARLIAAGAPWTPTDVPAIPADTYAAIIERIRAGATLHESLTALLPMHCPECGAVHLASQPHAIAEAR